MTASHSTATSTDTPVDDFAMQLLATMIELGELAILGDPAVEPYFAADAIKVVDGVPLFHKDRFQEVLLKMMNREDA